MGRGQLNLSKYYMGGGGSTNTPKMYYVIYEQPLMIMIRIMNVNDNVREAHGCLDNGL